MILAGVSEGGLITTLSVERYPGSYKGGLAMCGPIGDFQKQANYWGDFRVLYDVYYPELGSTYGGSAVNIPDSLITAWYGNRGASDVRTADASKAVSDPQLAYTKELLTAARAPYVEVDRESVRSTVLGLLDYSVFATMNAQAVLGGNPYDNRATTYAATLSFPNLNSLVARFSAGQNGAPEHLEVPDDRVTVAPAVVLHNEGDLIVPYWHAGLYSQKVATGSQFKLNKAAQYYGHCSFTMDEVVASFNDLGSFITGNSLQAAKSRLSPSQYDEYVGYLRREGKIR